MSDRFPGFGIFIPYRSGLSDPSIEGLAARVIGQLQFIIVIFTIFDNSYILLMGRFVLFFWILHYFSIFILYPVKLLVWTGVLHEAATKNLDFTLLYI